MKNFLLIIFLFLSPSFVFAQSFEGKLTYLWSSSSKVDTHYVYIRGDSIRIDLGKWMNASTSLYFIAKNQQYTYSKRDKAYLSYPIINQDMPEEVLAYELKHTNDSITLFYKAKLLNTDLNIESTTTAFFKLHPQLQVPFLKGTYVEPYVLNGSGYLPLEVEIDLYFNDAGEKRNNQRLLIAVDRTKPKIELFEMKNKQ
jgi:hypothetical protein